MTTQRPHSRCLGLIGGLGVGATLHYYRGVVGAVEARERTPRMLLAHADVATVREMVTAKDYGGLARYLAAFVDAMANGGAELAAIVAATPHVCAAELAPLLRVPLVDLADEISRHVVASGLKRVALLGTRFTIETRMFGRLSALDVVMPRSDEVDRIDSIYFDIVFNGASDAQLDELQQLARALVRRDGAEAVLLAGTDLAGVLGPHNTEFPVVDCAAIHIDAIARRMGD